MVTGLPPVKTPPGFENVGSAAAGRDDAVLEAVAVVVDDMVAVRVRVAELDDVGKLPEHGSP